jgi:hypothetical protein
VQQQTRIATELQDHNGTAMMVQLKSKSSRVSQITMAEKVMAAMEKAWLIQSKS